MALERRELVELYARRAARYDLTANLYYLIGFREWAFRKAAVAALELRPGDSVVEIGCGTGLNFSLLVAAVGEGGSVIGVDLSRSMIERAWARAAREGWTNVRLYHGDAADYEFPDGVDGILSTFALTLIPEFEEVIRRGSAALAPGGHLVVADLKLPAGPARRLAPVLEPLVRPFGVTLDLAVRHPWEAMERSLDDVTVRERYMGFFYIASGRARGPAMDAMGPLQEREEAASLAVG